PSSAVKNSLSSRTTKLSGDDERLPRAMSLTRDVPDSVPSERHSYSPCSPSSTVRKNCVLVAIALYPFLGKYTDEIGRTRSVPSCVPLRFQGQGPGSVLAAR